ncbi:unnamed protein product [Danaus chrysippus]|uniref:(African queen) hypothetical protein n=1 Tax=Danaus chrysippus TaxID=151541 RepID=A0A8J2R227_9NEOP|nr:unnamed protein product [Danaus chrysippus]
MFFVVCVTSVLSNINIRRGGWLDRVVEYYKNRFYDDLIKTPPVKIKARIERPPPGYIDSSEWDYNSVIRLLSLLRDSEESIEVRRVISRTLRSSRRFMSISESLKAFPSLAKYQPNDFYYSMDSGEYYADVPGGNAKPLYDDDVIVVSNPVEARLPSARITTSEAATAAEVTGGTGGNTTGGATGAATK